MTQVYLLKESNMSNNIIEMIKLCGRNNIEFVWNKNDDKCSSQFLSEEKRFILNVTPEDDNIEDFLNDELEKLKDRFQ